MSGAGSIYASRGTFCARTIKETGTYDLRSLNQNKRPLDAFLAETRLLIQGSGYPPDFHDELMRDTSVFSTCPSAMQWFTSYLKGRLQQCHTSGSLSNLLPLKLGVPQRSILGLMLFSIYINDLRYHLPDLKLMSILTKL